MDANNTQVAQQTGNDTSTTNQPEPKPAAAKAPKNGKLPKIKRKLNSYRLGFMPTAHTQVMPGQLKKLIFTMPATLPMSTPEEAGEVQSIAARLAQLDQLGVLNSVVLSSATWEITITLKPSEITDEDDFLSDIFRQLSPTVEKLPKLMTGFRNGAAAGWKYQIGAQVLDQDSFN